MLLREFAREYISGFIAIQFDYFTFVSHNLFISKLPIGATL